ncbi:MAG: helix-turn-helix domain-containing protein [Ruminococcaceae bacterium]|nr:helix-turn-helix domain-containing protein [Oscillospiraceae bacterium]
MQCIDPIRLFCAKVLIRYSTFSISEICYRSGFQSMAYFSKLFKNRFSQSPNSFRSANIALNTANDRV